MRSRPQVLDDAPRGQVAAGDSNFPDLPAFTAAFAATRELNL
jgi:hypothetical protein